MRLTFDEIRMQIYASQDRKNKQWADWSVGAPQTSSFFHFNLVTDKPPRTFTLEQQREESRKRPRRRRSTTGAIEKLLRTSPELLKLAIEMLQKEEESVT